MNQGNLTERSSQRLRQFSTQAWRINLAHASRAKLRADFVTTESCTGVSAIPC